MLTASRVLSFGLLRASSSAFATFCLPLASAMHMSFALADSEPQPALADLYSAAILSLPALYSSFDMPCAASAPALNARVIAVAITVVKNLFMDIPFCGEAVG